ncbi:MAG: DegT/DnrJ/EryC1/StrS family aminotransferase, partial [Pseudomonadota bacterium]
GGGAVLTNDIEAGVRAKHLSTTAKQAHPWRFFHDEVGYNYRMPNINAALGCAQLEQLENFLVTKRRLNDHYRELFLKVSDVHIFEEPQGAMSNYWLCVLLMPENNGDLLEETLKLLIENKVGARPVWDLMCDLPMYKDCPSMNLSGARELSHRILCLPSSVYLGDHL